MVTKSKEHFKKLKDDAYNLKKELRAQTGEKYNENWITASVRKKLKVCGNSIGNDWRKMHFQTAPTLFCLFIGYEWYSAQTCKEAVNGTVEFLLWPLAYAGWTFLGFGSVSWMYLNVGYIFHGLSGLVKAWYSETYKDFLKLGVKNVKHKEKNEDL